jgi:hypothetical protein
MTDGTAERRVIESSAGSLGINLEDESFEPRPGFKRTHVILGRDEDHDAARVYWAKDPPGVVWDPQSHNCDMVISYLQGSQKVGDKWYNAGDARIVKAGTVYGPIEAGPEGSTVVIIFSNADYQPIFEGAVEVEGESPFVPFFEHVRTNDD